MNRAKQLDQILKSGAKHIKSSFIRTSNHGSTPNGLGFTWTKASQQIYLTFFANIQNVVVDNWAVILDMFNLDARL